MEKLNRTPIKVYIKINENNEVTDINSSIFIKDTSGWIEVDSGFGDKYAHAQSTYLKNPLTTDSINFNYLFINNNIIEKNNNS